MKSIFGISIILFAGFALANGTYRNSMKPSNHTMSHMEEDQMTEHNRKHMDRMQAEEEDDSMRTENKMKKRHHKTNTNKTMPHMRNKTPGATDSTL